MAVTSLVILFFMALWPLRMLFEAHQLQHLWTSRDKNSFQYDITSSGIQHTSLTCNQLIDWKGVSLILENHVSIYISTISGEWIIIPKMQIPNLPELKLVIANHYQGKKHLLS